jgi:hypothetical protein
MDARPLMSPAGSRSRTRSGTARYPDGVKRADGGRSGSGAKRPFVRKQHPGHLARLSWMTGLARHLGSQAALLFDRLWITARSPLQEAGEGGFPPAASTNDIDGQINDSRKPLKTSCFQGLSAGCGG